MHLGMFGIEQQDRPHAGDLVGHWRHGRPIYLPGGGSTPPEAPLAPPAPAPPGAIPITVPPAPVAPPAVLTSEDLAQQRAQWERDAEARLAAREAELRRGFDERLAPFEQERAEREAALAEEQRQREEAERQRLASEETAAERMERFQRETQAELQRMREEAAAKDQLLAREQERSALIAYRGEQLAAHSETIHPAMHSLVNGFSREEIDAAIVRAEQASEQILAEIAQQQQQQAGALAAYQRAQPGASVTAPPIGPTESLGSTAMLTNEQLAALDPREYEALRPQLLAAASAHYHGQLPGQQ